MDGHHDEPRAQFKHMEEGTAEDWKIIGQAFGGFAKELPDRVITHLQLLEGDCGGFPVDRLTHCLQTATLAHRDGQDEEYVVCALLHDIGDTLGPYNHADVGAALLEPFVSEENHWMVKHTPSSRATTSSSTWAWTRSCARSTATTRASTAPWSSAPSTMPPLSTRSRRPCRCRSSSRCCAG